MHLLSKGPKGDTGATGPAGPGLSDGDKGDIVVSASGATWTIDTNAVSFSKFVAAGSAGFVGATGAGNYAHRTIAQATADLNAMVGDSGSGGTKGLVPAPAAGDAAASKFLKADGTWATAGGGSGTVTSVAVSGTDGLEVDSGSPVTTSGTITLGVNASTLKAHLSLNNVENTALSTWAGSTNITTLGTVATGTWQGTAIGDSYISSASAWNAKQAGDATLDALSSYADLGIVTLTASDTFTGRTITGTANEITVTNGSGVAGNPTLSLPATIDLGGKTSLEIPNGTSPTVDAAREIAIDTDADGNLVDQGLIVYHDGTQKMYVPAVDTLPSTDAHALVYDATLDKFKFAAQSGSGGGGDVVVNTYTSGSGTWTKPANAVWVFVQAVGGGGGGGSGRRGASSSVRCGGGSGACGAVVEFWFPASIFSATESYSVGTGGGGGVGRTTNDTDGNNGTAGGNTTFANVVATGGPAGFGGTNTTGNAGTHSGLVVVQFIASTSPDNGGAGGNNTAAPSDGTAYGLTRPVGQFGGGGGITSGNSTQKGSGLNATTNYARYRTGVTSTNQVNGGAAGGANNGDNGIPGSTYGFSPYGTNGGGGGSSRTTTAGDGGDGGNYGGGGGGGGASENGFNSGAGGDGAGGYLRIITWCEAP